MGEVLTVLLVGWDVALLLFSWPSVATLFFPTLLLARTPSLGTQGLRSRLEGGNMIPIRDQKREQRRPSPIVAILTPVVTSQVSGALGT